MAFFLSKSIHVKTLTGKTLDIDINLSANVATLKYKIENTEGIPPDQFQLIHAGRQLENHKSLSSYGIQYGQFLHIVMRLKGLADVSYNRNKQSITIGAYGGYPFDISTFHVSCRSDKFTGENMTGVVLYKYDNKQDWHLNGIHCKSGYIILKLSKNIAHIKNEPGKVHGACYKSVFGKSVDKNKVVGGGFGYVNGVWKFNSWTFNVGSKYHNGNKGMDPKEKQCIEAAAKNWTKGTQNTSIKDIAKRYNW
mmetsp:Transcript_49999/g.44807  ORF Transcript_49999/g.44807 Transcript_49999/m.44807 type:complete len:251 (+) Transcript_49999:43-795(+)